jgi:hypothetical protein
MNYALNRVVALFLCLVVGLVWVDRPSSHPPYAPSQSATTKDNDKTSAKTIEERHEATEEAIADYTLSLMAFTGILAVATGGLGALNSFKFGSLAASLILLIVPKFCSSIWF